MREPILDTAHPLGFVAKPGVAVLANLAVDGIVYLSMYFATQCSQDRPFSGKAGNQISLAARSLQHTITQHALELSHRLAFHFGSSCTAGAW